MAPCDQDMVEVQNRLGPRNPKEAALTITGEFSVVKGVIQHLTDVMLDAEQVEFVKLIHDNFAVQLGQLDIFVKTLVQSDVTQLVPFMKPLQAFYQKHTKSPIVEAVPDPSDLLDARL